MPQKSASKVVRKINGWTGGLLAASFFAALLVACGGTQPPPETKKKGGSSAAKTFDDPVLARGMQLYTKHCAVCHGNEGLGDGKAAVLLSPKPRDFSTGQFRLTSTQSGLPSDDDILATLRRGMPGSAMPSWDHFPDEDLNALVSSIHYLAQEGKASQLASKTGKSSEEAHKLAENNLSPGEPVSLPAKLEISKASIARGKTLYKENCAACHGPEGRGKGQQVLKNDQGVPVSARDFTLGVFKGGINSEDLAHRLLRGMPGSPMPGSALAGEDLWPLVHFIQSLVKEGAQDNVLQVQTNISVHRTHGKALPGTPEDTGWDDVDEQNLPLMPLWWRDQRVESVRVKAVHNGERMAILLSWEDATLEDTVLGQTDFSDGAAIQFSLDQDPPFFGMGGPEQGRTNLWHWLAAWERDSTSGIEMLKDRYPNMPDPAREGQRGAPQGPEFMSGEAVGNPMSAEHLSRSMDELNAEGLGTLTSQGKTEQNLSGKGVYTGHGWKVMFQRQMISAGDWDVTLENGKVVPVSFAVWNGADEDRDGQKSVTIWHSLVVED